MTPEGLPSRKFNPLAELLGQPDEDPLRASDVTEPIRILVLHEVTNQLGTVRAEPGERIVDVLDGEHDAQVAESVHWGVPVIGDHRRREKSRKLEAAVTVRRAHHCDLDALVAQPGNASCPFSFDRGSPFELESELDEKSDGSIEGFHHDADVVHPLKRHAATLVLRPGRAASRLTR
jgi:hypothetical protein